MSDTGQEPQPPELITKAQAEGVLAAALDAGISRWKTQGSGFSEPDYLAGVGVTLAALGQFRVVPPYWWFAIARGESVLSPELQDKYKGDEAVWTLTRSDVRALLSDTVKRELLDDTAFIEEVRDEVREQLCPRHVQHTVRTAAQTVLKYWEGGDE